MSDAVVPDRTQDHEPAAGWFKRALDSDIFYSFRRSKLTMVAAAITLAFFLLAPFILLGAAVMTLVASFTKSYKEAQTWLSVVLIAPTLPILIVSILNVRAELSFMFVPSLSQHLILVDMVKNEPLNLLYVVTSVTSTLFFGAVLTWVCARLYRREGLLG